MKISLKDFKYLTMSASLVSTQSAAQNIFWQTGAANNRTNLVIKALHWLVN